MARIEEFKTEIRRTFALVEPISTEIAAVFYPTLWTINPATKVQLSASLERLLCGLLVLCRVPTIACPICSPGV